MIYDTDTKRIYLVSVKDKKKAFIDFESKKTFKTLYDIKAYYNDNDHIKFGGSNRSRRRKPTFWWYRSENGIYSKIKVDLEGTDTVVESNVSEVDYFLRKLAGTL